VDNSQNPPVTQSFTVRDAMGDPSPTFPFQSPTALIDPRVEYDRVNGRFWMMYTRNFPPLVHLAVSRNSSPDTFKAWDPGTQTGDWYYFTGSNAFNLAHGSIPALQQLRSADHPMLSVKGGYLYLMVNDATNPIAQIPDRDALVIFPLSHAGGSMLAGARPSEADLDVIQLRLLQEPLDPDFTRFHYPIQEPHEELEDIQFFITTRRSPVYGSAGDPQEYTGLHEQLRLCGARRVGGQWEYHFADMDIGAPVNHFFNPPPGQSPATPHLTWRPSTGGTTKIDSGVLARNALGQWRIFTGHHVVEAAETTLAGPSPTGVTEYRYYVIDPDIAGFPGSWTPSIEVVGRAPTGNLAGAATYQGAIGVNVNGQATITFTRSGTQGPAGWPSLVRARLTANYTAVQYEISTALAQGPRAWYVSSSGVPDVNLGSDYADMQAAPNHCGYWAIGTIVAYIDHEPEPAVPHDKRAIWLTEIYDPCSNNAELNGDGVVDIEDLALYLDHYATGAPQADMDGDTSVDSIDYLTYSDEYAKR
jgi:hypothetical protein